MVAWLAAVMETYLVGEKVSSEAAWMVVPMVAYSELLAAAWMVAWTVVCWVFVSAAWMAELKAS